jgi:hypothetical protein
VDELQDPVGYDGPWLLLAVAGLVAVALYYAAVLWLTRPRPPRPPRRPDEVDYLARLDAIEAKVAAGEIGARAAHQQISRVLREYAAAAVGVPATTMTLAELERRGPHRLARIVADLYEPEFAPDDTLAEDRLPLALAESRALLADW